MLCLIVAEPKFQNFAMKCCFLTWGRVSRKFDCYGTLKRAKVDKEKKHFWSLRQGAFFEAKNEEKVEKISFFFVQVKKQF